MRERECWSELAGSDPSLGPSGLAIGRAPCDTLDLVFAPTDRTDGVDVPIWEDVSALAIIGRSIFCACDETSTVERVLSEPGSREAGAHESFMLGRFFDLPDGGSGEMDIEGLAIDDGYLWISGSHALARKRIKDGAFHRLHEIDWDPNRGFLGRIPLADRGDGVFEPVGTLEDGKGGTRRAAMLDLPASPKKSPIRKLLRKDRLIGDFVDLPSKENGLDVEGLAVRGTTVLLGLRGPVLRGTALIVAMQLEATRKGKLKPVRLDGGAPYALQGVTLAGQGIRDLHWAADGSLYLLSGATTDHQALQSVHVIRDYDPWRMLYGREDVHRILDLQIVRGADNAEGIGFLRHDDRDDLIVVFDAPHRTRVDHGQCRLRADLFRTS